MVNGEIRFDKDVLAEDSLELANGVDVKSAYELLKELKKMDDETFVLHISKSRHDFRDWIDEAYGNEKLARKAGRIKGRHNLIKFLEKNIERSKHKEREDKLTNLIEGKIGKEEALESIKEIDDDLTRGKVK